MSIGNAYKQQIDKFREQVKAGELEIVAYVGVQGSGKSYQASQKASEGFVEFTLADPPRELVAKQLKTPHIATSEEFYTEFKDTDFTMTAAFYTGDILPEDGIIPPPRANLMGRDLIIGLAEGLKQYLGKDIWIKIMFDNMIRWRQQNPGHNKFVVSDARFWYEVEFLLNIGARVYFTNYKSERYYCADTVELAKEPEQLATWFVLGAAADGQRILKTHIQDFKSTLVRESPLMPEGNLPESSQQQGP